MIKRHFNTTSKREYITPIIEVEELEKQDILTVSVTVSEDNGEIDAFEFGDSGGPVDLFNQLFGNGQ